MRGRLGAVGHERLVFGIVLVDVGHVAHLYFSVWFKLLGDAFLSASALQ
jgi:hypothetical protein